MTQDKDVPERDFSRDHTATGVAIGAPIAPSTPFTPGPWRVAWTYDDGSFHVESSNGQRAICKRGPWTINAAESLANARLIAAAPELYEALKALLTVAEMTTFSDQYPAECEAVRAALSKAGGRQ